MGIGPPADFYSCRVLLVCRSCMGEPPHEGAVSERHPAGGRGYARAAQIQWPHSEGSEGLHARARGRRGRYPTAAAPAAAAAPSAAAASGAPAAAAAPTAAGLSSELRPKHQKAGALGFGIPGQIFRCSEEANELRRRQAAECGWEWVREDPGQGSQIALADHGGERAQTPPGDSHGNPR